MALQTSILYSGNSTKHDPLAGFRFQVEFVSSSNPAFSGIKAGFQKVSGLKADVDVIEYREGGDNFTFHKFPGLTKFDPITLERGMSGNKDLWEAFIKMFDYSNPTSYSDDYKFSMKIKLYDRSGENIIKTWVVKECWISGYEAGDLDATSNNVAIEKLTIQHEGFILE